MEDEYEFEDYEDSKPKELLGTIVIILFALFIILLIFYFNSKPKEVLDDWTMNCIAGKSILIVKSGCSACATQKNILGDYTDKFTLLDAEGNPDIIRIYNITKVPTWVIKDEVYEGVKTIEELINLTGCYQEQEENQETSNTISEQSIIQNCTNLSLSQTAYCLRDNVKTFYKFNVTDDAWELSFNTLVERGGDCRNYAFLYSNLAGQLGFENKTIPIKGHRFAVISKDGYFCVLNLLRVECFI